MAKDQFLVIRLESKDLKLLKQVARDDHLAPATWARQVLLRELHDARSEEAE